MTSLYDVTIPVFLRALDNLDHLLAKAEASGIDAQSLVDARLIDDMHPLPKQIQIASDTARFCAVRLGGAAALPMADEEKTLPELRERIQKTIAYLKTVDPAGFDGRETATIELKLPSRTMTFTGLDYVRGFVLPNFFFHVTTAYALLRMKGVAIGKTDYLAGAAGY